MEDAIAFIKFIDEHKDVWIKFYSLYEEYDQALETIVKILNSMNGIADDYPILKDRVPDDIQQNLTRVRFNYLSKPGNVDWKKYEYKGPHPFYDLNKVEINGMKYDMASGTFVGNPLQYDCKPRGTNSSIELSGSYFTVENAINIVDLNHPSDSDKTINL